jgi:GT2 family glycosyltransferase
MDQGSLTFSIVVPTFNRPEKLVPLLRSLVLMDYPKESFEVIIVDDGSERTPQAAVAEFKDQLNVILLLAEHGGPARARQKGIDVARGKFLAFTDDDCAPATDWLTRLESALSESPNTAVGGQTVNALKNNPYSTASQLLISYMYQSFNEDPNRARYFATNNLAFPAEQFRAIGGLDLTWTISGGEDRDLCERWLRQGYQLVYAPQVIMHHSHHLTLRSFMRQHFHYGRGAFRYHRVETYGHNEKVGMEPLSFYVRLPCFAFSQVPFTQAVPVAALLILSQVATVAGFVSEWTKSSSRD